MITTTDHVHRDAATAATGDEPYEIDEGGSERDDDLVELVAPLAPGDVSDLGRTTGRHVIGVAA